MCNLKEVAKSSVTDSSSNPSTSFNALTRRIKLVPHANIALETDLPSHTFA